MTGGTFGDLQSALLARTLEYAVTTVPFYRNLPAVAGKAALILSDFPILRRDQIDADIESFLVLDRFPDYVVTSGGSSGGAAALTFRIAEEYESAHHFFTGTNPLEPPDLQLLPDFTLDIFFNSNGYTWRKPRGWPLLSVTLEQRVHADLIRRLIVSGLPLRGGHLFARHIQAQNGPLRALTGYFAATGFLPKDFQIRSLLVYGAHVSRVWRERLRSIWGVDPLTIYGLTEFGLGNAMHCSHCNGYHYWTAWPEFFSLDGETPVNSGDAALVLTSLVPFVQLQPRIRYWTGDIVRILGYCDHANQLGFRFRGREVSSIVRGESTHWEVVLSEIDVLEVLEQLPGISCRVHPSEQQIWADKTLPPAPFVMGFPRFSVAGGAVQAPTDTIDIAVEVLFDPNSELRRARELCERILAGLHNELPSLKDVIDHAGISLSVALHGPGQLPVRIKLTV